ncbi:MAG: tRNA (adenosine(37)-N6)-threonylcarbamoyltransferase complex dimerization subunit type 1 TsaB [Ilumatobacteraceae bacterium]|nr:tRNA (adenosine(37)-N6)-threonylcarbamoyltransferase complex dimerization subunit type 1 TsaB [Ilumatobacteraceae bacterium]
MIVLGIDTATDVVSVAVVDGDVVLAASELRSERRHAEDLTPMIDFVVKRAGLAFSDLAAIAVNVGPGLFTGMRVGIASAQALAYALSLPLVGIDGLAALAAAVPAATTSQFDIVVPTIDARRREVAWATHRVHDAGATTRVDAPQVGSIEDLLIAVRERGQNCLFVGDFAARHRDHITAALGPQAWGIAFGDDTLNWPHAKQVALLAHGQLMRDDSLVDEAQRRVPSVPAMYLREADAEINWVTRSHA